jgi:hypothetical protein
MEQSANTSFPLDETAAAALRHNLQQRVRALHELETTARAALGTVLMPGA